MVNNKANTLVYVLALRHPYGHYLAKMKILVKMGVSTDS